MAEPSTAPRVVREILGKLAPSDLVAAESLVGLHGSLIGQAFRPARYRKWDMDADEFVERVCELAAVDGSLGWLAAMFNSAAGEVAALGDRVVRTVWDPNPDAVVTAAHRGSGALDPDGRLTGTWELVVGAEYAEWLVLPINDDGATGVLVPREAARIELIDKPSVLVSAGLGDVTVVGWAVDDGHAFERDRHAVTIGLAGAAAAVTGAAEGVWRRHVEQMRTRLATSYSGDELANSAPAQVGRTASDIDAARLQIAEALRRPATEASESGVYEQAVARACASADRLLANSRHALERDDPATRLWRDVHAGRRLAAWVFIAAAGGSPSEPSPSR